MAPPVRSLFPWHRNCIWSWLLLRRIGRGCVNGPRANRWRWHSGAGSSSAPCALVNPLALQLRLVVAVAQVEWQSLFLMARTLTDGVGVAARATPPPPCTLVVPLAPLLCSINAFAEEKWQKLC